MNPGRLGIGAIAVAGVAYGVASMVAAGPRVLPGVGLCILGLGLLFRGPVDDPGPAGQTVASAGFSASIAGWAFVALVGRETYPMAAVVTVGVALAGLGESAWLVVTAWATLGRTGPRSRRWWRLFYLALMPAALGFLVAVIFGIQANGTREGTRLIEIVGWAAAVMVCLPPVVSVGPGGLPSRGLLVGVVPVTATILAVSLLDPGDWLRVVSAGSATALLGWSVAGLRAARPMPDNPATVAYIRRLIVASTIGGTAGLALLSLILLARTQ